ncbi:MAG: hypothetical protein AAFX76_09465, partial [Planctomycetota bacterium]
MARAFPLFVLTVTLALAATGCRSAVHTDYAAFVQEPRPTAAPESQTITVVGQVDHPGPQPHHGPATTVLDVVSRAAPTARADVRRIQVLRLSPDTDHRRRLTVDLDALTRRADNTLDVVLAPGDLVVVPPTPLANVGLTLAQPFAPLTATTPP